MDIYKLCMQDIVVLLKCDMESAKAEDTGSDYDAGVRMGMYYSLNTIKHEAVAFGIPLEELGLADFHLEKFL
ncbi:MAG: hypothetical protein M3R25_05425 [Bacteroidota bacterium]|nr:hypothetical protein [Bacteroidota bacterium]